jgi:hypothetical protein
MKRFLVAVGMAGLGLLILCGSALAQDNPAGGGRGGRGAGGMRGGPGMGGGPAMTAESFDKLVAQLGLSDEQKKQAAELKTAFDKKEKDGKTKLEDLDKKIKDAGDDQDKLKDLRQQRRELTTANGANLKDYMDGVKKILKDEQSKKLEELAKPPVPALVLVKYVQDHATALGLKDEQVASLKKVADKYPAQTAEERQAQRTKMMDTGTTPEERTKMMQEMRDKTVSQSKAAREEIEKILTKDQVTQLADLLKKEPPAAPAGGGRGNRGGGGGGGGRGAGGGGTATN